MRIPCSRQEPRVVASSDTAEDLVQRPDEGRKFLSVDRGPQQDGRDGRHHQTRGLQHVCEDDAGETRVEVAEAPHRRREEPRGQTCQDAGPVEDLVQGQGRRGFGRDGVEGDGRQGQEPRHVVQGSVDAVDVEDSHLITLKKRYFLSKKRISSKCHLPRK